MKLRFIVIVFISLWLASAFAVPYLAGDLQSAGNFGASFGGVSALFSGMALALAIYAMVLQQRQVADFERVTVASLKQQGETIALIQRSLEEQASAAQVVALNALIDREEQRIGDLRQWGALAGDENKYSGGIRAAQRKIEQYKARLQQHALD